ncbi:MAG: type II toxin-antitoxin system HicB family antitoxin [Methanosarcina sp.]
MCRPDRKDKDEVYIGTVPEPKGCYSYGDTLDELMENIREAILAHPELLKSKNKPLPPIKFQGIQEIEIEAYD